MDPVARQLGILFLTRMVTDLSLIGMTIMVVGQKAGTKLVWHGDRVEHFRRLEGASFDRGCVFIDISVEVCFYVYLYFSLYEFYYKIHAIVRSEHELEDGEK